jgi:hypothetical protein
MCKIFRSAPGHVRSALLPAIERNPRRRIYDHCHDAESSPFMDRGDYHALLDWVDRNCLNCVVCKAA